MHSSFFNRELAIEFIFLHTFMRIFSYH